MIGGVCMKESFKVVKASDSIYWMVLQVAEKLREEFHEK
jgi:hypothetical protein